MHGGCSVSTDWKLEAERRRRPGSTSRPRTTPAPAVTSGPGASCTTAASAARAKTTTESAVAGRSEASESSCWSTRRAPTPIGLAGPPTPRPASTCSRRNLPVLSQIRARSGTHRHARGQIGAPSHATWPLEPASGPAATAPLVAEAIPSRRRSGHRSSVAAGVVARRGRCCFVILSWFSHRHADDQAIDDATHRDVGAGPLGRRAGDPGGWSPTTPQRSTGSTGPC